MGENSRVVFGGILLVGFCFFLLFGVSTITRVPIPPTARVGVSDSRGATRRHEGMVVNYASKRRVPNGPDPIHNRYVPLFTCAYSLCVYIHMCIFMDLILCMSYF